MKVAVRQKKLLEIFKYSSGFLTAELLAETLQVSKRTIHNDLAALEAQGNLFQKKPGVGIRLQSSEKNDKTEEDFYSPDYRRNQILKILLFQEQTITYQSMAEKFMVSISSIIADLNYLKKNIFQEGTLELVGNEHGTRLVGKEIQWNKTLIVFNEYMKKTANLNFRDQEYHELLAEFYPFEHIKICYEIVTNLKSYNIYYVADYYLENVFHALLALVYRVGKGYHHNMERNEFFSEQIMKLMNYVIAKDLLELIEKKTEVHFSNGDIYLFSVYLKANRISFKPANTSYDEEFARKIREMIDRMSDCSNVNLQQDHELYESLYLHMIPMIHRLKYKIMLKNPMLDEIKSEYRLMFELTWLAVDPFVKELGLKMTEDEVGFLMLYFQNALEKQKKSKRIVVVCPNGLATSTFIANKIRKILPPLDIIELASLDDIHHFNYSNIDFIVSTVPLEIQNVTVVIVSMLLNANDLRKIEKVYKEKIEHPIPEHIVPDIAGQKKYLKPTHVFFHEGKMDKNTMIHKVCDQLRQEELVTKNFEASIFDRERKGATDNIFGGAIPHAEVSTVKQTCLAVWVNKEPMKWTKYRVKVIVFCAIAEEDLKFAKLVLKEAFAFIQSKKVVEWLSSVNTREELMEKIFGGNEFDKKRINKN